MPESADYPSDLDLAMHGMGTAAWAELLDRKFFRLPLFILGGGVVAPLAAVACQPDKISHDRYFRSRYSQRQNCKAHHGNRTRDLFLTKEVLYRLSYMGIPEPICRAGPKSRTMERETGLEPATPSLEGSRSTN